MVDLLSDLLNQRFRFALMVRHGSPPHQRNSARFRERNGRYVQLHRVIFTETETLREREIEMKSEPFILAECDKA